jgi:hypothetical protein
MISNRDKKPDIVFIGFGVVNALAAFYAVQSGFDVTIIDKNSDFRNKKTQLNSSTLGSIGDARHISIFEHVPKTSVKQINLNLISSSNWLKKFTDFTNSSVDIKKKAEAESIRLNQLGLSGWEDLMRDFPELFIGTELQKTLVKIFHNEQDYQEIKTKKIAAGSFLGELSNEEKEIYGSEDIFAIKIKGYSFRIKVFMSNILEFLEEGGAKFLWEKEAHINRNDQGLITSLQVEEEKYHPQHIFSSTGIEKFENSPADGVLGLWKILEIPSTAHHLKSFKIHSTEKTLGVVNVTVTKTQILISAGFILSGQEKPAPTDPRLKDMFTSLDKELNKLSSLKKLLSQNLCTHETCFRPMSPTGLRFKHIEKIKNTQGTFTLLTAHSTSGTTQAPESKQIISQL